jgi:hypothetical protein
MNNYLKHILVLFVVTAIAYGAHYLISATMDIHKQWSKLDYSLKSLYFFGACASLLVSIVLITMNRIMPKNLGSVFLIVISVKVLAFYAYIYKGLEVGENNFLKYNFIIVFFIYLIFDVFVAFKALNEDVVKA